MDLNELIRIIDKLETDFYECEGGHTHMLIDGHDYHTDTGYAMDGIQAFVEVLKERLIEVYAGKK